MTAAGIAFIAGGIATLICLRSVLFGRGKQPEGGPRQPEGGPRQLEGRPRQRSGARVESPAKQRELEPAQRSLQLERPRRQPALTETAELSLPTARRAARSEFDRPETPRQYRRHASHDDDLPGGLASIGLADEDDEPAPEAPVAKDLVAKDLVAKDLVAKDLVAKDLAAKDPAAKDLAAKDLAAKDPAAKDPAAEEQAPEEPPCPEPDPLPVTLGEEESRPISVRRLDRSDRAYGDRVDGWIRPEYHDDPADLPSGEYWTPLPMEELDLPEGDPEPSARGYGWPTQVERLPAVPDYEPATGFDLTPVVSEPTELVPAWPPMPDERRIRLPRSWASRDTKPADNRFLENDSRRLETDDADQRFRAPTGEPGRRRPRPRPRPAAGSDNVYVSRHAADPPH
jgi:hypothetical protein